MSAVTSNPAPRLRRIVALVLIVLLSIALPAGIFVWSVISATSGKPLGRATSDEKGYGGVLFGGKLYFAESRTAGGVGSPVVAQRMKCLDLETGVESDVDFPALDEPWNACVVKDEIYLCGENAVHKIVGSTVVKVSAENAKSPRYWAQVCEFDGYLTNVVEISDGLCTLCQLIDGQWVNGRKFLVPPRGASWVDDPQAGITLQSPDAAQRARAAANPVLVSVVQQAGQLHVAVMDDDNGFAAYRCGLEIVDDDPGEVSALSPVNDVPVLSGWERIEPWTPKDHWWHHLATSRACCQAKQ